LNAKLVILSCAGTLMVILNKSLAKALHWFDVELYGRERGGIAFYRGAFIFIGVVLTCLSFLVYE